MWVSENEVFAEKLIDRMCEHLYECHVGPWEGELEDEGEAKIKGYYQIAVDVCATDKEEDEFRDHLIQLIDDIVKEE